MKVTVNQLPNLDKSCVVIQNEDGLLGEFTERANSIFAWCAERGIEADLVTKWYDGGAYSAWRVADDK